MSREIAHALTDMGLLPYGENPVFERLTGGVSSDIWKVSLGSRTVCVKRALARLRVAAEWRAPVARNGFEVAWMRAVAAIVPEAVPRVVGADPDAGLFVMDYLDPASHPLWKDRLRDGIAAPETARAVAARLVRIHEATAGDGAVAARFATDHIFHPIRLEPYLLATARAHPDRAAALEALAAETLETKIALVHGDVSPKNILIGPRGPVFLDAECAWYGDPAFDLAFCLNHLLLKCLWNPGAAAGFLACFDAMAETYLAGVRWESRMDISRRIARLLPGLLLARIDGKSPVEYITSEDGKDRVRRIARRLLADPVDTPAAVRRAWEEGSRG